MHDVVEQCIHVTAVGGCIHPNKEAKIVLCPLRESAEGQQGCPFYTSRFDLDELLKRTAELEESFRRASNAKNYE